MSDTYMGVPGMSFGNSGGGSGGEVTKTYVDGRDDFILSSAKDYTDQELEGYVPSPSDMTKLMAQYDGAWKDISTVGNVIYVNKNSTELKQDGSFFFPYKTIQGGINGAAFGDVLQISPDEYNENLTINNKNNLTLEAFGTIGQYRTVVDGTLTISGTSERLGISNIQFNGLFNHIGTKGLVYIDNCSFNGFTLTSSTTSYFRLDDCFFNSAVNMNSSFGILDIRTSQVEDQALINQTTGTMFITSCDNVTLNHSGNAIFTVRGATSFISTTSQTDAIVSTSNTGALYLLDGVLFNGTSTYRINKTGTCTWCLDALTHEPTIDILNGTRVDGGKHATDIYAHFTPKSYTPPNDFVQTHLIELDNVLSETVSEPTDTTKLMGLYNNNWKDISYPKYGYTAGTQYQIFYVDNQQSVDSSKSDGSWAFPFATINEVLSSLSSSSSPPPAVIHVRGGTYSENVTLSKNNITIIGEDDNLIMINSNSSNPDSAAVRFTGTWVVSGGGIRISNCNFAGVVNMQVPISSQTFVNYFFNCSFTNTNGIRDPLATFGGNFVFTNCSLSLLTMNSSDLTVELINCVNNGNLGPLFSKGYLFVTGGTLILKDCIHVALNHVGGFVYAFGSTYFGGGASSGMGGDTENGIISTSNAGGLYLLGGSMYSATVGSPNGLTPTWKKIVKTGNCPYTIGTGFNYKTALSTFTGTRTLDGGHGIDTLISYTPINYTVTNPTLEAHLQGIDNALATNALKLRLGLSILGLQLTDEDLDKLVQEKLELEEE